MKLCNYTFFNNKILIYLLLSVIFILLIKSIIKNFKKENFDYYKKTEFIYKDPASYTNEEGKEIYDYNTRLNELAQYIAKNLVPTSNNNINLEEDTWERIERELIINSDKVPHKNAIMKYNKKREEKLKTSKMSNNDTSEVADLDREFMKYLYGNDSTEFNNDTREEDKKRLFIINDIKLSIPGFGDQFYKVEFSKDDNEEYKEAFYTGKCNFFKQKIEALAENYKTNIKYIDTISGQEKVDYNKLSYYEKGIDLFSEYICSNIKNQKKYSGSPINNDDDI